MIGIAIGMLWLGTGRAEQVWILGAKNSTSILTTFFVGCADVMSPTNKLWGMDIPGLLAVLVPPPQFFFELSYLGVGIH